MRGLELNLALGGKRSMIPPGALVTGTGRFLTTGDTIKFLVKG